MARSSSGKDDRGDGEKGKRRYFSWDDHFFGSVTIGERGQVVIPAEARKRFGFEPGDRLLVMADPAHKSLMLCRMDDLREFMNDFQEGLARAEREAGSPRTQNDPGEQEEETE